MDTVNAVSKVLNLSKKDEDPKNKPIEKPAEVARMKRGDYMVHVFVEQAKNILVGKDNAADPVV